jgi:integrase
MPLSDAAIRNAKSKTKSYKITDGGGLFLWIQPHGGKWWRYRYRFAGKQKLLALGIYPDVSLVEARKRHAEARKILATGIDPGLQKKEVKRLALLDSETTFEAIATEWWEGRKHKWATSYSKAMMSRLKMHVFPKLGSRPITQISSPEWLSVVRIVEKNGSFDLTRRLLEVSAQIYRFAVATGRAERNPIPDLKGALIPFVRKHQAYLKEDELPDYLEKLEVYDGNPQTKIALKFLLLTFVRTTELRAAEWKEFSFDKAEWRIPAERMKMKEQHIVPLASQTIALLNELKQSTGGGQYLFPNQHKTHGCMSANTMIFALYRMGYHSKATGHGFRATASTILNENGFQPDVIERQLAHAERNEVRAAYNHAQYLPERRKMMQWWADYLDAAAQKN